MTPHGAWPLAAKVAQDTPARAAALTMWAVIGGAGAVFVKVCGGGGNLSYGDAWVVGSAAGVAMGVIYLLI
jgi:hypothetical protein